MKIMGLPIGRIRTKKMHSASWAVTGTGVAVSGLGAALLKNKWGAGILGFGLAHVVLGLLDMARPEH